MDMLIKLYRLPSPESGLAGQGVVVRRAMAYERSRVVQWVREKFNTGWADECSTAFGHTPVGCYIAIDAQSICGFCCLNTTFQNYIGPVGVSEKFRRKGIGRGLVLAALDELRHCGYAYAVAGDVGQPDFFKVSAGAFEIPGSTPGPYPARVRK